MCRCVNGKCQYDDCQCRKQNKKCIDCWCILCTNRQEEGQTSIEQVVVPDPLPSTPSKSRNQGYSTPSRINAEIKTNSSSKTKSCKCKTSKCATKQCGCNKNGQFCGPTCQCPSDCKNQSPTKNQSFNNSEAIIINPSNDRQIHFRTQQKPPNNIEKIQDLSYIQKRAIKVEEESNYFEELQFEMRQQKRILNGNEISRQIKKCCNCEQCDKRCRCFSQGQCCLNCHSGCLNKQLKLDQIDIPNYIRI